MRSGWMLAITAAVALGAAPVELAAQGRSQTRQEQAQREAERERLRQQRELQKRAAERIREQDKRAAEWEREQQKRAAERVREEQKRAAEWQREQRRDDRGRDARDIFGRSQGKNGRGPAFCRSGAGHPVHGREWCRQKGFGLGSARDVFGDVIFRQPRDRRYDDRALGRSVLGDILGSVVLGRFESYGHQYGGGAINGRWLDDYGTRTLQLNIGNVPLARLVDTNRDGRVDDIVLRR